jgi:hypothetical protein
VVLIPAGQRIALDVDPPRLGGLVIEGELSFDDRNVRLQADYIVVKGAAGKLQIGSPANPFRSKAVITLTGSAAQNINSMGSRALQVMGGTLEVVGTAPAVAWTQLNAHAEAQATQLTLKQSVNWRAGDRIVVAPTDFYGVAQTETLTLSSSAGGSTLALAQPLQAFRWGRLQYVTRTGMSLTPDAGFVPPATPFPTELDQRAEVGNLTRNIVIEGADDTAWRDNGFGAHVMVMERSSKVLIDGVEMRRAGQAGLTGRYPIHWHMLSYDTTGASLGDVTGHEVRNSTVSGSANRCIVIHATNGVQVRNNICHDITGHAFFLEDAVERRNTFEGNLALKVRNPSSARRLQTHEGDIFQAGSSGFWLTNPDNIVRGNAAADTQGNGFWLSFPTKPVGLSKNVAMKPDNVRFGVFENNVAHSANRPGVLLEWVPINDAGDVTGNKYTPTRDEEDDRFTDNRVRFELKRVTSYKNRDGAYRNRVSTPDYTEWVTADNTGTYFAGAGDDGLITRHLVVGTSLNNRTPYPAGEEPPVAFASYHSTFNMARNVIVGFPFVPGQSSGAFKTDDYYITPVDKGTVRNIGNVLINSHPGYRTLPPALRSPVPANEHWSLAGALWDPHGYWGPAGQYLAFDTPFLTADAACQPVAPAGSNGMSCAGEFHGVGAFVTDFDTRPYDSRIPIDVRRLNAQGAELGLWTVADGDTSNKLGNMRHFAARTDGHYVMRFPGKPAARMIEMTMTNASRTQDHFMMAVAYAGRDNPTAYAMSGQQNRSGQYAPQPGSPYRRDMRSAASLADVRTSAGDRYYIDRGNQLLWFRYVGGLPVAGGAPNSDEDLYRPISIVIDGR